MRTARSPFTDPAQVQDALYVTPDRIGRRTSALHRARVSGRHAAEVIADLAVEASGTATGVIADVGCGRGTSTAVLAARLPQARIIAIDLSSALVATAKSRLPDGSRAGAARADFHHLPFRDEACNLAVAAFCLYHSTTPQRVIAEMARCLAPGGTAILAVKSASSYRELDELIAASGLDSAAPGRPSLYEAAHTGNIEDLAVSSLGACTVTHDTHVFTFPGLAEAAEYLATSPKYVLPLGLAEDHVALAGALRQRLPDQPVTTTSVVTYLTGHLKAAR